MIRISNPQPFFLDARGALSDGGYIYIGHPNADPETMPLTVYWDKALTVVAAQPLRTIGGLIVNGATPANVFTNASDYSLRLRDSDGVQAFYSASTYMDTSAFQPVDSDLTAIAALGTTAYGRNLLLLADQNALRNAVGYPPSLPLTGGTVSGYIFRQGTGPYLHWADPSYNGDTFYVTESGAGDPTVSVGDWWVQLQ